MRGNPEFRRNLWLQLSPLRLMAAPVIAAIAVALLWQFESGALEARRIFPAMFFVLLTAMWGARHAADAVAEEISTGTWDFQRMSALGAWAMSWGKLFGATIFDWYCGLFCLIIFVAASFDYEWSTALLYVIALIGAGLAVQAAAMLGTLIHRWRQPSKRRIRALWGQGVGFLALFALFPIIMSIAKPHYDGGVDWYGIKLSSADAVVMTLAVCVTWLLIGIYRLMRVELQYRNLPWIWPVFLLFGTFYVSGFPIRWDDDSAIVIWPVMLFVVAGASAYLSMLGEPKSVVRYHWLLAEIRARAWGRAFSLVPLWVISYALSVVAGLALMFIADPLDVEPASVFGRNGTIVIWPIVIAGLLFMMRDMAFMMFFSFAKGSRRGDVAAVAYLFVCYWLLSPLAATIEAPLLMSVFFPFPHGNPVLTIAPPLLEAAIALWLAWRRLQSQTGASALPVAA